MMADDIEGRFAALYDALFGLVLSPIRRHTVNTVQRCGCRSIVDLGCGTGDQCRQLWQQDTTRRVHGVDRSPDMVAVARRKSPAAVAYHVADSRATGFTDDRFDCAILSLVLHAQDERDQRDIMAEARRIVNEEGVIILTDFSQRQSWKGAAPHAVVHVVESFALGDHRRNSLQFRKQGALRALVAAHGFSIQESQSFYCNAIETIVVTNK